MLVLVRRLAPLEAIGILAAELVDELHCGAERGEPAAVEDVDLAASARVPRVFLERRLEERRPEVDARKVPCVHLVGEPLAVDPRRPDHLERPRRPTALGQHRSLEQHRARIDDRAVERRQIRRRNHPGETGLVQVHRPLPAVERDDLELGADAERVVEEPGELADRHPVAHRDRKLPDEGREGLAQPRALDRVAADGIRSIADDHPDAVPRRGTHAVRHGVDERVDARADVLQIDDQHVEPAQHVGRRLTGVAVEREDRDLAAAVAAVRRLDHVVLQVRAEPVLRSEERRQRDLGILKEPIRGVLELRVDRGWVAHEADALARDEPAIERQESIDPGCDGLTSSCGGRRHDELYDAAHGRGGRRR